MLVLFAGMSLAQTSSGTIAGVVTDQTGAVVAGATVTATSTQTGVTAAAVTGDHGAFRLDSVTPGIYTVTVEAKGFTTTKVENLDVRASIVTPLNPSLKIGASTTIEVESQIVPLATESGEISASIGTREIQDLPIASINPYSLALTLPGVTSVEGADMANGPSFSVNGSRPRTNNFLIEGQDNNDSGIHGQGLQPGNLEAVSEVAVLTNSYSAEYGHGGGAVSNMIVRTGSNQFHGSVWDRLQNSSLDATDKQDKLYESEKSKYRENIYGFTIGGPIKQNKLFFFASYQWDKYRTTANTGQVVLPTEAGVATLLSLPTNPRIDYYLAAIGNLRGQVNPFNVALGNDPLGQARPDVEFGYTQRTGVANLSNSDEFDATGDYVISEKDTLHLRYIRTYFTTPYDIGNFPSAFAGFDTMQQGPAHNAGFSETHTFNQSVINEFRMSYGRIGFDFLLRPETLANPLAMGPTISIGGITVPGVSTAMPQGRFHNTFQFQDSLSVNAGKHSIKIGLDYADIRVRDQVPFNSRGSISYQAGGGYSGLANAIDDRSGARGVVQHAFGSPVSRAGLGNQNFFVQDNWKILPNLTLNLGIRYEYWGTPANKLMYPAVDPNNLDCFPCRVTQKPDRDNWGPRLGVAYTPRFWESLFGNGKTVIGAGFGIYYDGLFTNITNNTSATSPNAATPQVTGPSSGRGYSNWSGIFDGLSSTPSPLHAVNSIVPHLLSPRTLQWNLKVERELPASFVASIGYVGSRGEFLYGNNQLNPYDPMTGERRNPNRDSIVVRDNSGDSIYHALNAQLDRKFSHGFLARASYTYSKMMDDVSEVFTDGNWSSYPLVQWPNPRKTTDWARSAYDHTHRFALSYVYEIPKWQSGPMAVKQVVNGWQIAGTTSIQSGTPVNVFVGYDSNGDGISNDRPMLGNPAAPMASYAAEGSTWFGEPVGTLCDGWYWWNTNDGCHPVDASSVHWIVPAYGTEGNVRRNSMTSPGVQKWDFAIQRTFSITEKHKLDFRAEMFNVFNHGNPDLSLLGLSLVDIPRPGSGETPAFANYDLTQAGHRNIRLYLKYSF